MDVTIVGPVFDASGYSYHTRTIARELHRLGVRVRLNPSPWGAARVDLDARMSALLDNMMKQPDRGGPVLFITVANSFSKDPGRPCLGWTMLETDSLPPFWVQQCNSLDEVWVPTGFNRETFARSGVDPGKIEIVPLGTHPERFGRPHKTIRFPGQRGFTFLSNFEWIPRKGYDILLRAYIQEFSAAEDVTLILKTYDNSAYDAEGTAIKAEIRRIVHEIGNPNPPQIILLTRVLSPDQLPDLYAAADCYVVPTRGEGWNHPALEAAASGLPVITTAWSGHLEFLNDTNSYLIPIKGLEPVPAYGIPNDAVYTGSRWAIPSLEDTRRLMRHVFCHRAEARGKGRLAQQTARQWTWEQSARIAHTRLSRWAG